MKIILTAFCNSQIKSWEIFYFISQCQKLKYQVTMRPTSVFVGGLGYDIEKEDLEKEFSRFGTLNKIWVARNPPGFAFIEFEDDQDADAAIKEMNGAFIKGCEIRVDLSRGGGRGRRGQGRGRPGFGRGRGGGRGGYERSFSNSGRDGFRNSGYRSRSPMNQMDSSW